MPINMPVGPLVHDILKNCHCLNNEPMTEHVWRLLNIEAVLMAGEASWQGLRASVELDMTTVSDSTGLYIPADLAGIDMVMDETNEVEFIRRDEADATYDEYGYRYYTTKPADVAAVDAMDLNITRGASTFTSAALDTWVAAGNTATGEYVKFGDGFGVYKITNTASPYTITPAYWGPTLSGNQRIQVRPEESRKLIIVDANRDVLQDRTVRLHYWKLPKPFYRNSDNIPFANPDALALRVLRKLPEAKPFRPVSATEIDNAMAEAKKLNPTFNRKNKPRDKHNRMFNFRFTTGNNLFANRNT